MIEDYEVPEGILSSSAYIVRYDEDLWYSFNDEGRKYCQDTWIKWAESLGLEEVVLRLIPDPIFPQFGKEKPYTHWRHKFPKTSVDDWEERITVVVQTYETGYFLRNPENKRKVDAIAAKYPKGTRFRYLSANGITIMEQTT